MPNYRRVWVPGGTYFFTVNLLERRRSLLVDHVDALRAAFSAAHSVRPFALIAVVVLPEAFIDGQGRVVGDFDVISDDVWAGVKHIDAFFKDANATSRYMKQ